MCKDKSRRNEAHRVPLPYIIPKVQSPAVSGGVAMLGSAAARAIGPCELCLFLETEMPQLPNHDRR